MDYFNINNTEDEILKLKEELMHSNKQLYSDTKSLKDTIKQIVNEDLGQIYEENLRQIFYEKLKWTNADITRKIYYIPIIVDNDYQFLISKECGKTFQYKNYIWKFTMNDYQVEMSFSNEQGIGKNLIINHNDTSRVKYYVQTKVEIGKVFQKEMDGIFFITKFDLSLFNYNEIEIL